MRAAHPCFRPCAHRAAYLFLAMLAVLTFVLEPAADAAPAGRIIGGSKVTRDDFVANLGFVVSVGYRTDRTTTAYDTHACGGTLIAPRLVLTARHCIEPGGWSPPASDFVVSGGATSLSNTFRRKARVFEIYRPGDDRGYFANGTDIAVLELAGAGLPGLPVARIARPEDAAWWGGDTGRSSVKLVGWGVHRDSNFKLEREFGPISAAMRATNVPLLPREECAALLPADPSVWLHHCTKAVGRSACYGDSGGPMLATDPAGVESPRVIGIASRVTTRTCAGGPNLYTEVWRHSSWLDAVTERSEISRSTRARPPDLIGIWGTTPGVVSFHPWDAAKIADKDFAVEFRGEVGGWKRELTRFRGQPPARIAIPPTQRGNATMYVRELGGVGGVTSADYGVRTRIDTTPPGRVARLTARKVGVIHRLAWTPAIDRNDRVVGYFIEQRRPGTSTWAYEAFIECGRCWFDRRARPNQRSNHALLPGRREFRITPIDRAGNWGRSTISR